MTAARRAPLSGNADARFLPFRTGPNRAISNDLQASTTAAPDSKAERPASAREINRDLQARSTTDSSPQNSPRSGATPRLFDMILKTIELVENNRLNSGQ
jgi:hypothetical protein